MRYKTKPFEVDAVRFDGTNGPELLEFTEGGFNVLDNPESEIVAEVYDYLHQTWVGVRVGDYIIRGSEREYHPCAPKVFEAKYVPIG